MVATADTNDAWPDISIRLPSPLSLFPRALCAFSCRPRGLMKIPGHDRTTWCCCIHRGGGIFLPFPPPLPFPIVAVLGCCPASRNARFMSAAGPHARVSNLSPALPAAQGKQPAAWRRPRSSPQKLHPHRLSQSYSTYSYVETLMLLPVSRARHHRKSCCSGGRAGNVRRQRAGTRRAAGPGGHLDGSGRMEQNVGIECLRVLCLFACLSVCPADRYGAASQETKEHRTSSSDASPSPPALHSLSSRIRFHLHEQAPPQRLVLPPPFSHSHDPPDPTGAAPSTAASPRCEPGINLGKSALDFFLIFPVRFFLSLFSSFPSILHACS